MARGKFYHSCKMHEEVGNMKSLPGGDQKEVKHWGYLGFCTPNDHYYESAWSNGDKQDVNTWLS